MENDSQAGSGGIGGLAGDGAGETWTTLNPNLNVVADVESEIGKWLEVFRFLNSPTPSPNDNQRKEEVNRFTADLRNANEDAQKSNQRRKGGVQSPAIVPPAKERIQDFSKLNRSDWQELNRHGFLLSQCQQRHLKAVEKKRELFPKRFPDSQYLTHSAILLLSQAWASAERYACCGIRNKGNPSGHCKLHKFCPSCCWRERNKKQLMFVPAFDSGNWFWLTGSFTGELAMSTVTPGSDAEEWVHYWDAYKSAFVDWVQEKSVRGVFWTEELAVNSLLPTRVLPHVHAIVEADVVGEDALQDFNNTLNKQLRSSLGPDYLEPNIKVEPITTARSLLDRIGYMIKPLNVLMAYERAWPRAYPHGRRLTQQLNSQVTDLVDGYSLVTTDRKKINVKGSLDSKAKGFIGIPNDDLNEYRDVLADIRVGAGDEYIATGSDEEALQEATP